MTVIMREGTDTQSQYAAAHTGLWSDLKSIYVLSPETLSYLNYFPLQAEYIGS